MSATGVAAQDALPSGPASTTSESPASRLAALKREGITIRGHYDGEAARNLSGGGKATSRYAQQLDIGVDLDLQKLWQWQGQSFHFTVGDRRGRSLSADRTDNIFQIQQVYGLGQNTRIYEISYEYKTPGQHFDAKAGWLSTGADFGNSPLFCQFESLAFCGHPMLLSGNSGWANVPSARWGFRLRWYNPLVYGQVGAFTANSTYSTRGNGLKMDLSGTTGVVFPMEVGYTPGYKPDGSASGHYRVGGFLDTTNPNDVYLDRYGNPRAITGEPAGTHSYRWGYYIMADQVLWRSAALPDRSFTAFANYSVGDRASGKYRRYEELGVILQSPFASRPADNIALGTARAVINPRMVAYQAQEASMDDGLTAVQSFEQMVELNYGIAVKPWLTVRPDVQYITRPGADRLRGDIWVFGIVVRASF